MTAISIFSKTIKIEIVVDTYIVSPFHLLFVRNLNIIILPKVEGNFSFFLQFFRSKTEFQEP